MSSLYPMKGLINCIINIMKYTNDYIRNRLLNAPKKPGCYLWKDKNGVVIYVGKAKNLANRTKQYFGNRVDVKTSKLVKEIHDVDFVVVNNENESLLLENNLIAKYKPKYNILLRETNSFPYIVVTKEDHPRILYSHDNKKKIKGTYYGPFATPTMKKYELYNFINRMFPLRKCKTLPKSKCIYYDIGLCLGPCIKNITKEDYEPYLKKINDFFSGKYKELDKNLEEKEIEFASKLMFEESQKYLELRKNLKSFSEKQDIIFSKNNNEDIIGFSIKENIISLVIFKYVDGNLLSKYDTTTIFYEEVEEIVETLVFDYYKNIVVEKPKQVYISISDGSLKSLSDSLKINFINPVQGSKKEMLLTAVENAQILIKNKFLKVVSDYEREANSLSELEELIGIDSSYLIEVFDNSNVFNEDKVSAMIVYENGTKNRKLYRKFIIKNKEAASDYEYMKEVIYRRYSAVLDRKESLPNLIIVDGGQIQVKAALESLSQLNLDKIVPVIGLAKNDKHKTDKIVKWDFTEISLDKKSNLYFFLLNMQDEVHRFAISFHRDRRSKSIFSNSLYSIKNLGKKRIDKLISKYQTLDNVINADIDELSQIVPRDVAIEIKKLRNK